MGFEFTLQAVLDHRLTLEEQAQRHYSEAQARVEAAQAEKKEIEADIRARFEQIREHQRRGAGLAWRQLIEQWIDNQRLAIHQLENRIEDLKKEVEKRRQALIKAMQAREVLEQLREQEFEVYRYEEARMEMKLFDEIAVRNYLEERNREKDADSAERIAR